jgi:predicted CXXCH cytochrome family protein
MSQAGGGTELIYLGTDLRNDHPISIQYAGAIGAYTAKDPDFIAALSTVAAGVTVYYVNADGIAGKSKNDFPLYNRTEGTLSGQALVECATCHDPHTTTTTFLRHTNGNNGSDTCLSCHDK